MAAEPMQDEPQAGEANDAALLGTAADEKIAELETQLREANEKALRSHAELENYRKRAQREMADERKYALVPVVDDLLPVVDNLQRAMEAASKTSGSESVIEGVKLVAAQLEAVLAKHGCVRIAAVGLPFDPNQHQAIAQEPSTEHPAGTVTREVQVGYKLHERVIRPAQVFVSTGSAAG
jgi:molecular chaperone GrpE